MATNPKQEINPNPYLGLKLLFLKRFVSRQSIYLALGNGKMSLLLNIDITIRTLTTHNSRWGKGKILQPRTKQSGSFSFLNFVEVREQVVAFF
jgi:hypothetical protein